MTLWWGSFRVHYAVSSIPDSAMPETGGSGSRALLEVRSHEVPFLIEQRPDRRRLVYERLTTKPDRLMAV